MIHPLHAYTCTKELEVLQVRFDAPPAFKGGDIGTQVNATVMESHRIEKSCRPVFWCKGCPVEEGASCYSKDVVPVFSLSILRWANSSSWFDFVAKFRKSHVYEGM